MFTLTLITVGPRVTMQVLIMSPSLMDYFTVSRPQLSSPPFLYHFRGLHLPNGDIIAGCGTSEICYTKQASYLFDTLRRVFFYVGTIFLDLLE